jgi:hypothetical protein
MPGFENVTYCGLYCKLCSIKSRTPSQAKVLFEDMQKNGWESYGEFVLENFKPFWEALGTLAHFDETCPDCRGGCGDPDCAIRKCAVERSIDICPFCEEYPCSKFDGLASVYPNLIPDGERMKEVGVEQWIAEQEQRCKAGFCYCDISYPRKNESE